MALITCPECGKTISDRAKACIGCGFPLDELKRSVTFQIVLDCEIPRKQEPDYYHASLFFGEIPTKMKNKFSCPGSILFSGLTKENAEYSIGKMCEYGYSVHMQISDAELDNDINREIEDERLGIIRCPKCKSTAITTGQRGYKFTTGFLGSSKVVNRCGACGYKWEP